MAAGRELVEEKLRYKPGEIFKLVASKTNVDSPWLEAMF